MRAYSRAQVSWSLYDCANSTFATTVMAGFFPVFFDKFWAAGLKGTESTYYLGLAGSAASLVVMILSPLLGAVADRTGRKKRFLALFTALGVVSTGGLFAVAAGAWPLALFLFTAASIAFFGGLTFYDSLLVSVAAPAEMDRVSALGYGIGYLGGGLLLAVNVLMTLKPAWFGLSDAAHAIRWSFITVAAWWALFTIPLLRRVPESPRDAHTGVRQTVQELYATLRRVLRQRTILLFLAAYWLYIDAVDTVIRMAVDFGIKLHFPENSLIAALLLVQFVAFPAAIAFGWLAGRIGTRHTILLGLAVYIAVTVWAYWLQTVAQFYWMAAAIALVQGGVQSLSRSYFGRLIPPEHAGEYFGFYNMLGKFAAVLGPVAMGYAALAFGSNRAAILVLLPFFAIGAVLLMTVRDPSVRRMQ